MDTSMRDATGEVQSAVVLGGNSDIATAVLDLLAQGRLERAVLAARDQDAAATRAVDLERRGVSVTVAAYDATEQGASARVLAATGETDLVIVAFGELGNAFDLDDAAGAEAVAQVGFTAAVEATRAAAAHLRQQGHGTLVVFTSVAGIRVRPENAVYGAAKAGLDGFALALADELHDSGVHVMVVRPGFVNTKMTDGMEPAPFSTTPERVAADVVRGIARRSRVVWSPPVLRAVFATLRVAPAPLWRRLARR